MSTKLLERGDLVAILPSEFAFPNEALEIAPILFAGSVYVQLLDGRLYDTRDGKSLDTGNVTYIIPAKNEHRAVLRTKKKKAVARA